MIRPRLFTLSGEVYRRRAAVGTSSRRDVHLMSLNQEGEDLITVLTPLLYIYRFLGCLPTVKTEGGGLEPSFRLRPVHCRPRHLVVSIYTTMVYCAVLVSTVLMIYQRILIIHYMGHPTEAEHRNTNIFDEYVTHYIPLLMVMCEPLVPMLYWLSTPGLCAYLAGWSDLERLYQEVTGGRLHPLPQWSGLWAAAAVLVVGGGLTAMSQMTPGLSFWYIITQSFSFTRMLSNAILWMMLCNAVTNSSKRFLEAYTHELSLARRDQKEEGGGRSKLCRYEQLWLRLKKQVQSTGQVLAFNYIAHFGTQIVLIIVMVYCLLCQYVQRKAEANTIPLLLELTLNTTLLFISLSRAYTATQQAGLTLIHELQKLMLAERSSETRTVISYLIQTIAEDLPVICVGGFFDVDRQLFTSLFGELVTNLIILMQFRGSSKVGPLNLRNSSSLLYTPSPTSEMDFNSEVF